MSSDRQRGEDNPGQGDVMVKNYRAFGAPDLPSQLWRSGSMIRAKVQNISDDDGRPLLQQTQSNFMEVFNDPGLLGLEEDPAFDEVDTFIAQTADKILMDEGISTIIASPKRFLRGIQTFSSGVLESPCTENIEKLFRLLEIGREQGIFDEIPILHTTNEIELKDIESELVRVRSAMDLQQVRCRVGRLYCMVRMFFDK